MNHTSAMVLAFLTLIAFPAVCEDKVKNIISEASPGQEVKTHNKVPFKNYWDAESWESKSGENFWNATDSSASISEDHSRTVQNTAVTKDE